MGFCDLSSEYDWNSLINTPNHISWLVHEPLTYHNQPFWLQLIFSGFFSEQMMMPKLEKQCLTLIWDFVCLFEKSRNIFRTKRSYSSEDELPVKILIWAMLMMLALIPGGLQISQDIVVCFLQSIMQQTFPHLKLAMICWLHPVHWPLDIHTLHRSFHWSLKYTHIISPSLSW